MAFQLSDLFKGGVEGLLAGVKDLIGIWKTDAGTLTKNEQEKALWLHQIALLEMELKKTELNAEVAFATAQTEINKIEASSTDWFVRRARPAAMWVSVLGFAYQYLAFPMLAWLSENMHWAVPPKLDTASLETCLFALLGIGAYRSFDKLKGTSR